VISEGSPIACAQCGKLITGESPSSDPAQRQPCPQCGSTARTLSASTEERVTASATIPIEVSERVTVSATAQIEVITYPQALLTFARKLIDDGQFSIAVIVSHMACEIAAERSLSESFAKKDIQYLADPVVDLLNGYNLGNDRTRKLYTALTGDEIQQRPFWQKFKESATRRNHVLHRGLLVGKVEAEDSFNTTSDLVAHLKK
jgi:hypothetical protein